MGPDVFLIIIIIIIINNVVVCFSFLLLRCYILYYIYIYFYVTDESCIFQCCVETAPRGGWLMDGRVRNENKSTCFKKKKMKRLVFFSFSFPKVKQDELEMTREVERRRSHEGYDWGGEMGGSSAVGGVGWS